MVRSVVTLALLIALAACGPTEPPPPPGPPLPRIWTLGPAAAEIDEPKIEVVLEGDGSILHSGAAVSLDGLKEALLRFAAAHEEPGHDWGRSNALVILRCHRALPWRSVQHVLTRIRPVYGRLYRVLFVVEPAGGGPEGTFALYLKNDGRMPIDHIPDPGERGHTVEVKVGKPRPNAPLDLVPVLRELERPLDGVGFELDAWTTVPVEYVLRVCDLLHREGVRDLHLAGWPPPADERPRRGSDATRDVRPSLLLDRVELAPGTGTPPEARRSAELTGFTTPPLLRHQDYWDPRDR